MYVTIWGIWNTMQILELIYFNLLFVCIINNFIFLYYIISLFWYSVMHGPKFKAMA